MDRLFEINLQSPEPFSRTRSPEAGGVATDPRHISSSVERNYNGYHPPHTPIFEFEESNGATADIGTCNRKPELQVGDNF